jgi:hypothetical protein
MNRLASAFVVASLAFAGCANDRATIEDGRDDSFTTDGKLDGVQATAAEAAAILDVVNSMSKAKLVSEVDLSAKTADAIVAVRIGDDEAANTADDETFDTLAELDAVPYVGPAAFTKLMDYVHAADLVGDEPTGQWTFDDVATGDQADFAVGPDGNPVVLFKAPGAGTYKVKLASGTTIDAPADATVEWNKPPQIAVDSQLRPHVFYPYSTSMGARAYRHVILESGQWKQHSSVDHDELLVDQGPEGQIFALSGQHASTLGNTNSYMRMLAFDATGGFDSDGVGYADLTRGSTHFAVGTDGRPVVVALTDGNIQQWRAGSSDWKRKIVEFGPAFAVATTGNNTSAVFINQSDGMWTYREETNFTASDKITTSAAAQADATYDAQHVAHACFVAAGKVTHITVSPTGEHSSAVVADGDQCWLGMDAGGTLLMFTRDGTTIRHATRD